MSAFNEIIKDILEINLKVKTDNDKERNISFSNFKKPKCPSVDIYSDKSIEKPIKQIKINMDCDSFDLCITENDGWIPVSERLPKETGYYLCSIEWYGTSTKELLISNGHDIENRIMIVHYLKSEETFKEVDNFCRYKVIAWMPLPKPYSQMSS
jgi:hypothetical protein